LYSMRDAALTPAFVHRVFSGPRLAASCGLAPDRIKTSLSPEGCDPKSRPMRERRQPGLGRRGTVDGAVRTIESRHADGGPTSRESEPRARLPRRSGPPHHVTRGTARDWLARRYRRVTPACMSSCGAQATTFSRRRSQSALGGSVLNVKTRWYTGHTQIPVRFFLPSP